MESTVKSKLDVRELGNGQCEIRYKSFRFGKGVRLMLFLLSILPFALVVISAFTSGNAVLAIVAIVAYGAFMLWLTKKQHTIVLTPEGIMWAGGRQRLAFKDISRSMTTTNLFGYGNSHGVQFEALGTTVVVADEIADRATATAIADLILRKMSAAG